MVLETTIIKKYIHHQEADTTVSEDRLRYNFFFISLQSLALNMIWTHLIDQCKIKNHLLDVRI